MPFMLPTMAAEVDPDLPYRPRPGAVEWRATADNHVALEIIRRSDQSFGFRYVAWVAWRDAGNEVRSHSWWEVQPDESLFTDELETAREVSLRHARSRGLKFEPPWRLVG